MSSHRILEAQVVDDVAEFVEVIALITALKRRDATIGQITGVRERVAIAAEFLSWLRARGQTLGDVRQADIDEWLTSGASTRYTLRAFLLWATRNHHVADVVVPPPVTGQHTSPLDANQRWAIARNLLHLHIGLCP